MARCSICWYTFKNEDPDKLSFTNNSECKHWNVKFETIKTINKRTFFDDEIILNQIITVLCYKCNKINRFNNIDSKLFTCSCNQILVIGKCIDDNYMRSNFKVPTKYCLKCKGSKHIINYKIKKCEQCDGMGGITCTDCNCHGYILKNTYSRSHNGYNIRCVEVIKCKCNNGYKYICKGCKGEKAILVETDKIDCKSCIY